MTGSISDIPFADAVIFASGKGVKDLYKNQQYINSIQCRSSKTINRIYVFWFTTIRS